jgi:hypothetical protein
VKILAVDETISKSGTCIFVAVVLSAQGAADLERDLREKLTVISARNGYLKIREFHAKSMVDSQGDWSFLETREAAFEIFREVVEVIMKYVEFTWSSLASKQKLKHRYRTPHQPRLVALRHLAQGAEEKAIRGNFHYIMIVDHHENHKDDVRNFFEYKRHGTPGTYRHTKLARMVDVPLFRNSEDSFLIQAADLVAYLYQKQLYTDGKLVDFEFNFKALWSDFCAKVPHERVATFS